MTEDILGDKIPQIRNWVMEYVGMRWHHSKQINVCQLYIVQTVQQIVYCFFVVKKKWKVHCLADYMSIWKAVFLVWHK